MTDSARKAALEILERCRRDGAWTSAALDSAIKKYGFEKRDAAFVSRLCLGVIQNETLCDYYIDKLCKAKLEPTVRDILRLGIYQLLFMDKIPARAAVNESVELCRSCGRARASGLVNAVLRKIASVPEALPEIPGKGSAEYLSVKYSHPLWLSDYVCEKRGYAFAEAFLAANNAEPGLTLQVNTLKISPDDYCALLYENGIAYTRFTAPDGCIGIDSASVTELPGFSEGFFYIQDRAARLVAEIAGLEPGMNVLDVCSCPGGKSFAAALRMKNEGSILSCDIHAKKLRLVREGAERLGIGIIETRPLDARVRDEALIDTADIVIADVPCSGLGVIAKKPEIRRKPREELAGLPEIQLAILNNASAYVKPGGVLLYSTCTIMDEENGDVVNVFLKTHMEYSLEAFNVCGISSDTGMYTFWPNVDWTDGFFAAKLRKNNG